MKAQSLPPAAGSFVQGGHDDRPACGLRVEFGGRRQHVGDERGSDPEVRVSAINGEPPEQQRGDGIRGMLGKYLWSRRAIDACHRHARVCHDDILRVGNHPCRGCVATTILAGVAAQPVIEYRLAALEAFTAVSA